MSEQNNSNEVVVGRLQVHNVGTYKFERTGESSQSNDMGMREMQARAYEKRDAQYLLIQAPPACGKSRALMFLALDKVTNQGLYKVIISVPQIAIGSSFNDTELTRNGFFADWHIESKYNLCAPGGEDSKVAAAQKFMEDKDAKFLLCSHATLVYFYQKIEDKSLFDNTLVAIDEFHHVSEEADNRLGSVIHSLMTKSQAHIVAMTGSYFRGDSIPVLSVEDEQQFDKVVYTYYEQLNGYTYLKSLGIDYAFYEGSWLDAIEKLIDFNRKTIIHIPSVNSKESSGNKLNEVGRLIDFCGERQSTDPETGIITVLTQDGKTLRIADLVSDTVAGMQGVTLAALRKPEVLNTIDIIIALGMAKEGFDWPQCEYALTVGYRSSLTEVVQIIGRATRDFPGKEHAQFTNLVAMPSAALDDVTDAVNSLIKAITLSLLMEQVLAPNIHFKKRGTVDPVTPEEKKQRREQRIKDKIRSSGIEIVIDDDTMSDDALKVVNEEYSDIVAKVITSSPVVKKAIINGGDGLNKSIAVEDVSKVIRDSYLDFSDEDIYAMSEAIVSEMILKTLPIFTKNVPDNQPPEPVPGPDPDPEQDPDTDSGSGNKPQISIIKDDNTAFVKIKDKMIDLDDLDFNMIGAINPFQGAYMFISKSLDPKLLKAMQSEVLSMREKMTEEVACQLWPHIYDFYIEHNRVPDIKSSNDFERRLAVALDYLRKKKSQVNAKAASRSNADTVGQ